MYDGYLLCVRFDVPMHEAIAAFSRQINVLYYFVLCFCFSVSRRQHEDNQTSGEIGVSVCYILSSLWATHHPTPFTFLLYFSCTWKFFAAFQFSVLSPSREILPLHADAALVCKLQSMRLHLHSTTRQGVLAVSRFWNKGALVCTSIIHTHHRQQQ